MSNGLSREEMEVIRKLRDKNLSYPEAAVSVLMLSRGHARPANELVHIIDVYLGLDNKLEIQEAINKMEGMGWLVTQISFGRNITKAAPDLQQKIAEFIQDDSSVKNLVKSYTDSTQMLPSNIFLVGKMIDEGTYGTFLDLMSNARDEICLPMLTTSPYDDTVAVLQERARKGVRIRLLLASPNVAKSLRGETATDKAIEAIKDWKKSIKGYPNIELRISHQIDDMCYMATSWTLDRHFLRYDFYDPRKQRSLEGYMIEFDSRTGLELNIINFFQERFDDAWNRAQPPDELGIFWWLKTNWQWTAFIITALISILLGNSIWGNISISISATFLFNALVTSFSNIKSVVSRFLR